MYGLTDYLANPSLMRQQQRVEAVMPQAMPAQYAQPMQMQPMQQPQQQDSGAGAMGMDLGKGLMSMFNKPAPTGIAPAGATQAVGQGMGAFRPEALAAAAPAAGAAGAAGGAGAAGALSAAAPMAAAAGPVGIMAALAAPSILKMLNKG